MGRPELKKAIYALLSVLIFFMIGPAPVRAAQVAITPASVQASAGDTVTLYVDVDNVTDLAGFQFNFSFDPSVLQVSSVGVNSGFDQQFRKVIDNTTGSGLIAAFALNNPSLSGTGLNIASITFTVTGYGSSNIGLSNVILGKTGGEEIASTSVGGTLTVNSGRVITATAGTGGTISAQGLTCAGSACTGTYAQNAQVTLTATPLSGYMFIGWSGACAGTGPCLVTMSQAQNATANFYKVIGPLAYISNYMSDNVSVIDTDNSSLIVSIGVGTNPYGVAVNPAGTRVYVANYGSDNVSVIDTALNTVIATIPVGYSPTGVAVNPSGSRVYVTDKDGSAISVIDTTADSVMTTIAVENSYGIAVNPAGTKAYVTNHNSNNVTVVNITDSSVLKTIPVGSSPAGIAFDPSGARAYVSNWGDGTVSVLDAAADSVLTYIPVGNQPDGVVVNPSGSRVYVANYGSDNVSVINTATDTVEAVIQVGNGPRGIAMDPAGANLFVANSAGNTISVIDPAGNSVIETVNVSGGPTFMAISGTALTVNKAGTGSGTITSRDGDINCGSVCSVNYPSAARITLLVRPVSGSSVADVEVDGVSLGRVLAVTFAEMTGRHSIKVTFSSP